MLYYDDGNWKNSCISHYTLYKGKHLEELSEKCITNDN